MNCKNIGIQEIHGIPELRKNWLLSAIEYASYNTILLIPVLISIRKLVKKDKNIKKISIISSIIVFILTIIIFMTLLNVDMALKEVEMPAVYAIANISKEFNFLYGIIILISIFTTAISLGISFLKNLSNSKKEYLYYNVFLLVSSIIFSNLGFSNLVSIFYPLLGLVGILQIFKIFIK